MSSKLNKMQKSFVDYYLAQRKRSQKEAAIRAGYSAKSAESQASQLLKNPKVLEYLREREKALESELRQEFIFDALEARKVMYSILVNPFSEDKDKINVAKDFLDRAGFKTINKLDVNINEKEKTISNIESLLNQMKPIKGEDISG